VDLPPVSDEYAYLWGLVEQVFTGRVSLRHPTISVKAMKGTKSTKPKQWPGLILSVSTAGLLMEGALLPLGYAVSRTSDCCFCTQHWLDHVPRGTGNLQRDGQLGPPS